MSQAFPLISGGEDEVCIIQARYFWTLW